ncbi:hypothetical protein [Actinomadura sp. HBU206391]|uniref:hypothetical protein n=1 Tax=Actinomadura sp. HBU206391 TaxID=2731692 RepID=UPI00164FDEF6|nr:hypothetical protein [Actinomadura sp. HBU206391]MBC6461090.1 hypothetical protein [Actinomadura sp. HBU206391]
MILTSRSYDEYRSMFDLTDGDLTGVTLDCAGGAAGFVAGAAAGGAEALAADPLYASGALALAERLPVDLAKGYDMISANRERFVWDWYGSVDRHREIRRAAGADFIADLRRRPGRYLAGGLPHLPLADACVDLVLCSHLLFTWARRFDHDWHRTAILEMCRVSRGEVRIFPLVNMGDGEPVDFLDRLRADLETLDGVPSECVRVPYEFQRGADRMLRVSAADSG